MPEEAEKNLRKEAKKKGFGKERTDRYVYGGLRRMGWKPSTQVRESAEEIAQKIRGKIKPKDVDEGCA